MSNKVACSPLPARPPAYVRSLACAPRPARTRTSDLLALASAHRAHVQAGNPPNDTAVMCDAAGLKFIAGNIAGVLATAAITLSNKDLLGRAESLSGPSALLLLHRVVTYIFYKLTYCCCSDKGAEVPHISWSWIVCGSLASNFSIVSSFFVLREATIAFHQLSRLIILPTSAVVDLVLYGKRRTPLEYFSIVVISYAVVIGLRGEVSATPRAVVLSIVCAMATLASSAIAGHVMKQSKASTRDMILYCMPYEIGFATLSLTLFSIFLPGSEGSAAPVDDAKSPRPVFDWSLALAFVLNGLTVVSVVWLTMWAQGANSNMLYAFLGQAKMLVTVAASALFFNTALSPRTMSALGIASSVAMGVALGEMKGQPTAPQDEEVRASTRRKKWASVAFYAVAFVVVCYDAATQGTVKLTMAPSSQVSKDHSLAAPSDAATAATARDNAKWPDSSHKHLLKKLEHPISMHAPRAGKVGKAQSNKTFTGHASIFSHAKHEKNTLAKHNATRSPNTRYNATRSPKRENRAPGPGPGGD